VRCATHLTIYRNTHDEAITVTDDGLESATSSVDTFGVFPEKDVNFVIGHTTPGKLVFDPPSCGPNNYHGLCPVSGNLNSQSYETDTYSPPAFVSTGQG
jgi:hypothetical protein